MRARDLPPPPGGNPGDVVNPDLVELLPGASQGLVRLKDAGFMLIVVSNQGSVARGAGSEDDVRAVNAALDRLLAAHAAWFHGARGEDEAELDRGRGLIDAFYFCPFHPQGRVPAYTREHPWRKPAPGMILEAAREHGIDLSRSWLIGDAPRDAQAGIAAGIDASRCLLVGPEHDLPDVSAAASVILARLDGADGR